MKIQFRSDYCEGAHQRIIDALTRTNMVQTPGYGEDEYCDRARELILKACGKEDAKVHFLVGGTQTNVTVISTILRPHQGVVCAATGHINIHETGAVEHSGHKALALPHRDGKISAEQIEKAVLDHRSDPSFEHMVQPGMVYISFPTERGTIYSKAELQDIAQVCRKYSLPLFIDGARLGYGLTCDGCDLTLKDIASLADVFYIGGTKQGALFGEAVVFSSPALERDFRYLIKQNGGMLAKGRLLGIQFAALFEDSLYFDIARQANEKAARIRRILENKGVGFLVQSPTNQLFPILPDDTLRTLSEEFEFEVWEKTEDGRIAIRICTSWGTRDDAVDRLCAALERLL